MLSDAQAAMVSETLRICLLDAAEQSHLDSELAASLAQAADLLAGSAPAQAQARPPHPMLPAVGSVYHEDRRVGPDDTAAAMGHPDPAVQVLGSPRLALWFEMACCGLLPEPGAATGLTHVGVGIVVQHLDRADLGETVRLEARTRSVSGRRAVFSCRASVGERLVATGVHHRVLLPDRPTEPQ
ncbi:MAG: thioesterase family protein [Nocardioidaceae bacterium]